MAAAAEMGDRVKSAIRWLVFALVLAALPAHATTYAVAISGIGGEPDYEQRFSALIKDATKLLQDSGGNIKVFPLSGAEATKARFTDVMKQVAGQAKPEDDFLLLLIGHGTFDGVDYKFNLVGPDVSGAELADLCNHIPAKRQVVVNTTSASGGSLAALEKPGRGVIAATKSGTEKNATVFARYWIEALRDANADVDKNESISALEAFQYATRKTADFYESQKRLATEHAIFDDTAKSAEGVRAAATDTGEGALLSTFTLLRIGAAQKAAADPAKRALFDKKEELERKVDTLKYQKAAMADDEYRQQLTAALVELARVQQEIDK
jgi:hypothetical protein